MEHAAQNRPEPLAALRAVLKATEGLASTLEPLDLDAFEGALAARSEALRSLEAAARVPGLPPPWADPRAAALRELSVAVTRADTRARALAGVAMNALREELKAVATAQAGLVGYRPPTLNLPRFADRKG